jgi:hypothetical protein
VLQPKNKHLKDHPQSRWDPICGRTPGLFFSPENVSSKNKYSPHPTLSIGDTLSLGHPGGVCSYPRGPSLPLKKDPPGVRVFGNIGQSSYGTGQCCSRGKWRLTGAGLKVAQKLWPELKPMSKKEVASKISFREAVHSVAPPRRARPRTRVPQAPKRVADPAPGIEVPFDY